MSTEKPVIADVVRLHVENAALLSVQYDAADRDLPPDDPERALIARRLGAQLDGVRIAGEAGWTIAAAQADDYPQAGEVFVLFWLAIGASDGPRMAEVFNRVAAAPDALGGIFCAVGWVDKAALARHVQPWLNARSWVSRAAGLHACWRHLQDPGALLDRLMTDADDAVRAEAARLAAALGRTEAVAGLTAMLSDPAPHIRLQAALGLAALGQTGAACAALQILACEDHDIAPRALDRAVTLCPRAVLEDWVRDLRADPAHRLVAIRAIGVLGDPACWPWLLGQMDDADAGVAAGLAACDLLGCAPAETGLFRPGPDFDDVPDRARFEVAHAEGILVPVPPEARSERARMLQRYRQEARQWGGR